MQNPIVSQLDLSADELLAALLSLAPERRVSILDSCGGQDPSAHLLIAGFDPFEIIESRGSEIRISRRGETEQVTSGDVLSLLDKRLAAYAVAPASEKNRFAGACIATFAYDLVQSLERLRTHRPECVSPDPDVVLAFYDYLVIHDYRTGRTRISTGDSGLAAETLQTLSEAAMREPMNSSAHAPGRAEAFSNFTRDEYLLAVERIQEHIAAGDIYQANLTQQITCALPEGLSAEALFSRLRLDHPASFAAFIRRREDIVISASPERFLRVEPGVMDRRIEACPIKGTRRRGNSAEEDTRLREELLESEKDRAENIMIVDLLRNDLGRVCQYGSVELAELCVLQELPTLFHLVSKVRGVLRDDVTAGDLLRAAFPCGSITGAPKIRAMEIIAEIEPEPRGLSMGAIGYFSFDGSLDLSVAIRTMVVRDRVARFNVGGGIVADSSAPHEFDESLLKARALLAALEGRLHHSE